MENLKWIKVKLFLVYTGIDEIELPPVEPFRMDSLSLAITGGSNGYKITLRDIDLYGASNFSIQKIL